MAGKAPTIAFLGPKASYTHQAALTYFSDPPATTLAPQISIEDVFSAVQSTTATYGVVPFENSTNGSVVFTLDLFADLPKRYPDIRVCGEVYVPVNHCLVGHLPKAATPSTPSLTTSTSALRDGDDDSPQSSGRATPTTNAPNPARPRAAPLADLKDVRKLYSHPQAWGQCGAFLASYLKGVERVDVSSTSRAAQIAAGDKSGASAAISSEIAAKIHGVDFLAKGIQDSKDNTTRFFVLRKEDAAESKGGGVVTGTGEEEDLERFKTLVSFTVDHEDPGALAASLAVFKPYKLNLTSINARPSGIVPWSYVFIVEIKGRKLEGEEGAVNAALRDLGKVARGWRWLGSWENKLVRG